MILWLIKPGDLSKLPAQGWVYGL